MPLASSREQAVVDKAPGFFYDRYQAGAARSWLGRPVGTIMFNCTIQLHLHMLTLGGLAGSRSVNAVLGWASVGLMAFGSFQSLRSNAVLWAVFTVGLLVVSLLPPWSAGRWSVMAPWPLLLIPAVAALGGGYGVYPEITGYVAVAALALLGAVELDAFTSAEMSRRFAVGFAVLTTLAVQGLWIVAQYYSDMWLGTHFLRSQRELQVDIVIVTAIGLAMGVLFEWYFARVSHVGSPRSPDRSSRSE